MRRAFTTDADLALRQFERRERGYLDMRRMERLDDDIRTSGPRAVRSNGWRSLGSRADIELADGTRLQLWLFWQASGSLASIDRAFFHDDIGWIVVARDHDGEPIKLCAYKIRVDPPSAQGERAAAPSPRPSAW